MLGTNFIKVNVSPVTRMFPRLANDSRCSATEFGYYKYKELHDKNMSTRHSSVDPTEDLAPNEPVMQRSYALGMTPFPTRAGPQNGPLSTVYVITPTYERVTQKADLLRLCYTLMNVPKVHWIVVEDSARKTTTVSVCL